MKSRPTPRSHPHAIMHCTPGGGSHDLPVLPPDEPLLDEPQLPLLLLLLPLELEDPQLPPPALLPVLCAPALGASARHAARASASMPARLTRAGDPSSPCQPRSLRSRRPCSQSGRRRAKPTS